MEAGEIDKLLTSLPIRPENLGRLTQIRREVAALAKDRDDWKREWDLFRGSWVRNLGGSLFNKRHLIDALAMTTEHQRVGYQRARAAGLIGDRWYRDDPREQPVEAAGQ